MLLFIICYIIFYILIYIFNVGNVIHDQDSNLVGHQFAYT